MEQKARSTLGRVFATLILIVILACGTFVWIHRGEISVRIDALGYHPTPAMSKLEQRLALTNEGSALFHASRPTLDASSAFTQQCSGVNHSEGGYLLGCFTSERLIHLFQVEDERLSGIVEVTATHELMHAAWARFPVSEQNQLVKKLTHLYKEKIQTEQDFKERMEVYKNLSRKDFANELHSIFATEVAHLPRWLEHHYSKWLADRKQTITYFNHYHDIFVSLKQEAEALQTQMRELREKVEQGTARYEHDVQQFNQDVKEFNRRNDAFEFSDQPEEFDRLASDLRQRKTELDVRHKEFEHDVERYEDMRETLKSLSDLSLELDRKLDSELAPLTPSAPE